MKSESYSHMAQYHTFKISKSPIDRVQNSHENRVNSTMDYPLGMTKQTISLPRSPQTLIEVASVPVTPDPNSLLKRKNSIKSDTSKRNKEQDRRCHLRLNKFVRRLHDMLIREKNSGIVEWRRGLLVLFSTDAFSKRILPRYFNTRNFKTFRRQLNYYGFVHVRSFSATGNTTTALWINQNLAEDEANDDVSAVLKLRRVEPDEDAKTVEGRRLRKALAIHTVEEDIGLNSKTLQLDQIRSMAISGEDLPDQEQEKGSLSLSPATAFLRPCSSSSSYCDIQRQSTIPLADSEKFIEKIGSPSKICSTNNNGNTSLTDLSRLPPSLPKPGDEVANTDAAASVLLMLSRS